MKFLLSIPCQLIVVVFVAVTVSSTVSKPAQPLLDALSVGRTPPQDAIAKVSQPLTFTFGDLYPLLVVLSVALTTFVLWHAYRFYRSEMAIENIRNVGAQVCTNNGLTGVLRYLFSDVKVNLASKHISSRTLLNLQQVHNLTSLNVSNCGINPKTLLQFEYCRFLEEIDVRGNELSRDALLTFRRKISATMHHASQA